MANKIFFTPMIFQAIGQDVQNYGYTASNDYSSHFNDCMPEVQVRNMTVADAIFILKHLDDGSLWTDGVVPNNGFYFKGEWVEINPEDWEAED